MTNKLCRRCGTVKPLSEFYRRHDIGHQAACKACQITAALAWANANPEKAKAARLRYGNSARGRAKLAGRTAQASFRARHAEKQKARYRRERGPLKGRRTCKFCCKREGEVERLIIAQKSAICDACVDAA